MRRGIDLGALSRGTGRVQNANSTGRNGRLPEGPNAIAGEWGHNPLPRGR